MNPKKLVTFVSTAALLTLAPAPPMLGEQPAAPWTVRDIGAPRIAGSTDVNASDVWTIQGSSTLLGLRADHLHFASQVLQGDASITARFRSMNGGHGEWSRAGLMIRANEMPGSPGVYLAMTPEHGLIATTRFVQDAESRFLGAVGPNTTQPTTLYIRLQRAGSDIAGFYSSDGVTWSQANSPPQALTALSESALFGLAVTSQQDGASTTGKLDRVEVQSSALLVYGLTSCSGDRTVRLQWRPVKNATAYHVYRVPSGATPTAVSETSFTDNSPDLVNGTAQRYAVAPVFAGSGGMSEEGPRVTITAIPVAVPAGFLGCSINEGARVGSANFDPATGTTTLNGSGVMTFDNADGCYFLNQPLTGDMQVAVRALTGPTKPSDWAVAGLMLRESLDAGSRYAAVWTTASRRLFAQWRAITDGFAEWPGFFAIDDGTVKPPVTLRLTRRGSTVTPEYSTDNGTTFQAAGPPIVFDPPLGNTVYIGLAIAAADRGITNQARFASLEFR